MTARTYRGYTTWKIPTADLKVGDRINFPGVLTGWPTPIARIHWQGEQVVLEADYESYGRRRVMRVTRKTAGQSTVHVPDEPPAAEP